MAALIAYTLPAMQLVCYLVTSGNSSNDVTNSANHVTNSGNHFTNSVSATTKLPPLHQATSLPDSYVANPDLGFAYKYHSTRHTWIQARDICLEEGTELAVIDSLQKMEYLARQTDAGVIWVLPGIIRVNDTWINANTKKPIPTTVVWRDDNLRPSDCSLFNTSPPQGLITSHCSEKGVFFCQIPILPNSA